MIYHEGSLRPSIQLQQLNPIDITVKWPLYEQLVHKR